MRISRLVMAAALVSSPLLLAAPAHAADGPGKYQSAQVGLTYTVYKPSDTVGLKRTSFELNGCWPDGDDQINAEYGRQGKGAWIGINESPQPCQDGPDEVGPAGSFTVRGTTARVAGQCPGSTPTCKSATRAGVRRNAYTTVTLPSGGAGLAPTYVEVYSQGLSYAQIKEFVRGLVPAQ